MLVLRSDDGQALADAERVLRGSHQRITRVSVLDELLNPVQGLVFTGDSGYALDGSVSQDVSRAIRRTVQVRLANPDGLWTPDGEGSAFYWDRTISAERGVVSGGVPYLAPLGVFQIDAPSVDTAGGVLSVSGSDRLDRATGSEFTAPEEHVAGTGVGDVIRAILEDAGVGTDRWTVDDNGSQLGAARSFEPGESRLQAALSLATSFSLEVFADARGYVVVQPKRDPSDLSPVWEFREGVDATHTGLSKRWSRDRFYNHVLVTNDTSNPDVPLIRAEASITAPGNPLRVTGPMGDRLYKYTSSMIVSQAQADQVALTLLRDHAIIEEEIALEHLPNPALEAGDAVSVVDPRSATASVYAILSIDIPLAGGPASLNVKKIRLLS